MNFSVGQEVRVKRTGEIGEIIEVHLDGMLLLDLDGDDIPVAKEDVEPYHPEYEAYYPKPNATLARAHQLHPEVIKGRQAITHKGVLLAFETRYDDEGEPSKFRAYLINDTHRDVVFDFTLSSLAGHRAKVNSVLHPNTAFPLYELQLDVLNDCPRFTFLLWPALTDGSKGQRIEVAVKLKPKAFFNNERVGFAPVINNAEAYLYPVVTHKQVMGIESDKEDLRDYTRKLANERRQQQLMDNLARKYAVREKAAFPKDIDLHIDKLVEYSDDLKPHEMLEIQLESFEQYLDRAIRVGMDSVFVIHGGGKGTLRREITKRAQNNPYVHKVDSGYHNGYGLGATEIIFKK